MSERLFAQVFLALNLMLAVLELFLGVFYGIRIELVVFPFVLYVAASGVLVSLRLIRGSSSSVIESVSMRRRRAKQDSIVQDRLRGYDVDEEFLEGFQRPSKPEHHKPIEAREPGPCLEGRFCGKDAAQPGSALEHFSLDRESFDAYIGRAMGAKPKNAEKPPDAFSVSLDASSLAREEGTPPMEFSHDPRAVMDRLRKVGGRS